MKLSVKMHTVCYDLHLALRAIRKLDVSVLLVMLTLSIGLAAAMTGYGVMASMSRLPVNVSTGKLYTGWVNSVDPNVNPYLFSDNRNIVPTHITMRDARYLLASGQGIVRWVAADAAQDISADEANAPTAKDQTILLTSSDSRISLDIRLIGGRWWSLAEEQASEPVAVIDTYLAEQLFGSKFSVGKNILINDHLFRVIGVVMPFRFSPHFYELDDWIFSSTRQEHLLIPYTALTNSGIVPDNKDFCDTANTRQGKLSLAFDADKCQWLTFWIDLTGSSEARAFENYLQAYQKALWPNPPVNRAPRATLYGLREWLTRQNVVPNSIRLSLLMSMGFLLLCIVSASGILTARLARDSREIALRRALGATKASIFRRYIFHSVGVSVLSGVVAIPIMMFGFFVAKQQMPDASKDIRVDGFVVLSMIMITFISGIAIGLVPAMRNASERFTSVLNEGG